MQRQPNSLQPNDKHKLQTTASDRAEQARDVACSKCANAKKLEIEHRFACAQFDEYECYKKKNAQRNHSQDKRTRPPHRVPSVGLDAVRDADQKQNETKRKGDV